MPFLKRECVLAARVRDRVDRGLRARERRDARDAGDERRLADQVAVAARAGALWGVDDEVAASAADQVDDRGGVALLGDLAHPLDRQSGGSERLGRPAGREQAEAEARERGRDRHGGGLVGVANGEEDGALGRQRPSRGPLGLGEGCGEVGGGGHHLAGRAHLGAQNRIAPGEPGERQHCSLDGDVAGLALRQLQIRQLGARCQAAGGLDEVDSDRLARERDGAGGARIDLEHVDVTVGDGELDVQEADDAERRPELADDRVDLGRPGGGQGRRRKDARRVA